MVQVILGNLLLAIAGLILVYPGLSIFVEPAGRGADGGGRLMAITLVTIPVWACLTAALTIAAARGGFDWVGRGRGLRFALVVAACLAMALVAWFSGALRGEPASQVPWAARPFLTWAFLVFPVVAGVYGVAAINSSGAPHAAVRIPMAAMGGLALLAAAGLCVEGLVYLQQSEAGRMREIASRDSERDRHFLEEVRGMDPEKDFGNLLTHTSEYENPAIRALALEKVRAHPNFPAELGVAIGNGWGGEVLRFLESNDVPDRRLLAGAVSEALMKEAGRVRDLMKREHTLRDDDFDAAARRALAVATKFDGAGVDMAPGIRAFRDALEEPRQQKINPTCRGALDQWLQRNDSRER